MIRFPAPRSEDVVDMLRDFAKLHHIRYHEIAVQSGIPASTVGGILGKHQRIGADKLSTLWKTCLLLAAEKKEAARQAVTALNAELEKHRANFQYIKSMLPS